MQSLQKWRQCTTTPRITHSTVWHEIRVLVALLCFSVLGNIVQFQWPKSEVTPVIATPTTAELLATACPLSDTTPVSVIISARTPRELLDSVTKMQVQLRNFTEYSYVEMAKTHKQVR
jgi:hypothetical protein